MSSDPKDLVSQLDAGDAPGWKPEEGDVLVGNVVALAKGWSNYTQQYYPIVTIAPDMDKCDPAPRSDALPGEPVAVHAMQYVLMDRFTRLKPEPGERIGIKVGPKLPTKDGARQVQTYTVKMDRGEDIWGDIANPRLSPQPTSGAPAVTQQQVTDDDLPL